MSSTFGLSTTQAEVPFQNSIAGVDANQAAIQTLVQTLTQQLQLCMVPCTLPDLLNLDDKISVSLALPL